MVDKSASRKIAKPLAAATTDVATFLASLDHPFKPGIVAVRKIILAADSSIAEGVKWNAPSFRTSEYFATFHLRAKEGVQLILHLGAKVRDTSVAGLIADPDSLLEWLGKDRATIKFRDLKDIESKRAAFTAIVRQWIKHV